MTFKSALLVSTAITLAATGSAFAGGVAPAAEPMVMVTPAPAAPTTIGYVELSFSTTHLEDGLEADFDGTPSALEGQAFARVGDFVLEFQGYGHTSVDEDDSADGAATLGAFGHYLFDIGPGTAGVFAGLTGGSIVEEEEAVHYGAIGLEYAFGGFVVSGGYVHHMNGDQDEDLMENFSYLAAGYTYQINDMLSVGLDGLYGHGVQFDDDDDPIFHEITFSGAYDISDSVRLTAGITHFSMDGDDGDDSDRAAGTEFSLGLSIALGGSNQQARAAIPFDTPNLHRPVSWIAEVD